MSVLSLKVLVRRAVGPLCALVALPIGCVRDQKPAVAQTSSASPPPPEWTRDLVIYEIATKAFTSPNGPESGTFKSLQEKLPYLEKLGVTGIWLTGHSLSDPHHFFNIWTQYAT